MLALEQVTEYIHSRPGRPYVLLDGKRGDIDKTATAYAHAAFESFGGDSATYNPYMGFDTLEPYLKHAGRGVFALCKTSNPGSNDLQTLKIESSGKKLYEHAADMCVGPNCERTDQVGLVVGATDAEAMQMVRSKYQSVWILSPGVGAQGGDLKAALENGINRETKQGLIIAVSRQISKAADPKSEAEKIVNESRRILAEL
jgi:orotidine 5'-phosphate decarboxylase subfamily 2